MNIELDHNCAWGKTFAYKRRTDPETATPIDCTGSSMAAQIRPEPGGELMGSFDIAWLDQENGRFSMRIEADAVNEIPDGVFAWDLIFTDALGHPKKIQRGTVRKQGTVTEP